MDAYARSPKVGDVPAVDRAAAQANFAFQAPAPGAERQIVPTTQLAHKLTTDEKLKPGIEKTFTGLHALHDARAGAAKIGEVKLAVDDAGYVANRTMTLVDKHFDMFEYKNLDDSFAQGAQFANAAQKELQSGSQAKFSGGTLDLAAALSSILSNAWQNGGKVAPEEAVLLGGHVARELERGVTPLAPDASHPVLQWVEGATIDTLGLWKGNIARTAEALGVQADPVKVGELEAQARASILKGPNADANLTLAGVLGLAGVDTEAADHRDRAAKLLQDVPLDQVPQSLAAGIVEHRKLQPGTAEWIAGRIVDLGGRPGNVGGLAAELDKLPPAPG